MRWYRVLWRADVLADSPTEAADKACNLHLEFLQSGRNLTYHVQADGETQAFLIDPTPSAPGRQSTKGE